MDQLALVDVGHAFGGYRVLRKVSFAIPKGGIVGLIGPNGSGKTTLFNIVSGFLRPANGSVIFDGRNIVGQSVQECSRAGMVRTFQTPKLFEKLSVVENIMVGCYKQSTQGMISAMLRTRASRNEMRAVHERATRIGAQFGLGPHLHRPGGLLTAGQRRLVELARACVSDPVLLMLDEPSSGLSTAEIADLSGHLARLRQLGLTILLVSHDMGLMDAAERVHVLSAGEIIASGSMQEIKRDRQVQETYLGA